MSIDQLLGYMDERRLQIEDAPVTQVITEYELGQIDMIDELTRYLRS